MSLEQLYTPWRMKYITSDSKQKDGCVFCSAAGAASEQDRANFLVYRGQEIFVVMNIYPYNTGHLMILPYAHVPALSQISPEGQAELIGLTAYFTDLLGELLLPDGFNVGLNVGRAAGAGIDDHLHLHVVPRWNGDSNFMTVIGETRVLPEQLTDTYDRIVARLKQQPPTW